MMLIKNGRIHVGNGEVLENADVLIKDGKILKVGQGIKDEDANVIDAKGMEVFPGFIDTITNWGCMGYSFNDSDNDEKSSPVTPEMNVVDAFDAENCTMQELYRNGITTVGVSPANSNVIGGQIAAFKTYGDKTYKMLVKESVGVKASVTALVKKTYGEKNVAPKTRMGIFSTLKKAFDDAKKYDPEKPGVSKDEKKEVLKRVLNREIPLFVAANTKAEVDSILNFVKDYDIELVICNGYMAGKSKNSIVSSNTSIVLGEQICISDYDNDLDLKEIVDLHKAGVNISISTTGESVGRETLLWNAINVYKAGIDSEEVLKMITTNPSRVLKIDDRVGTIEAGKDADLVIYTNNPIRYFDAAVTHTIIRGEEVYCKGGAR